MQYNLQPYRDDGDTTGKRNLLWYESEVFPQIVEYLHGAILDIGCGNGRLNAILHKYADIVVGIDPFETPNEKFQFENCVFYKEDIESFKTDMKFDTILFMGSFYIINLNIGNKMFEMCSNLSKDGVIMALWESKQRKDFKLENRFFRLKNILSLSDKITEIGIWVKN